MLTIPKTLSISDLSALTGRTSRTIKTRLSHLEATPGPHGAHLYDVKTALECIYQAELNGSSLDLTEERARLTKFQADHAQKKLDILNGEFISVEETCRAVGAEYTRVRQRVLAIPNKLAKPLADITDPALVREELDREIRETLEELTADADLEAEAAKIIQKIDT